MEQVCLLLWRDENGVELIVVGDTVRMKWNQLQ